MNRHRHLMLLAIVVCATAIAVYIFGIKGVGFAAVTAAIVIGIHVGLVALAFAFGGASLLAFVANGLHLGFLRKVDSAGDRSQVIHRARAYDLLVWALLLGRERTF